MLKAKEDAVSSLTKGIETLFKMNKVDWVKGSASFITPNRISVRLNDGSETEVEAKNVIIATGSDVASFPGGGIQIDEEQIVSSTGALSLKEVPKKLTVIGGGVIGLELGSVWSRLGSEVTVIEFLGAIGGAGIDEEIAYVECGSYILPFSHIACSKQFQRILTKQGIKFLLNTKVTAAEKRDGKVYLKTEGAKGGKEATVSRVCTRIYIEF